MESNISSIISYLNRERNFDISCYNSDFLVRSLEERLSITGNNNYIEYLAFLQNHQEEITSLSHILSVNVSSFFRDTITFEIISQIILPYLICEKKKLNDNTLRIWSTGCASGEEPCSMAIIIRELIEKERLPWNISIFGTDIDSKSIEKAKEGIYSSEMLKDIKYGLLKKYFIKENNSYKIMAEIKKMIVFSVYDLTDSHSYAPPESIFAGFDMVLCRNVLIYFGQSSQEMILKKLYRSLSKNGFLVLGEYEEPPANFSGYFKKYCNFSHIYQKQTPGNSGVQPVR